MALSVAEEVESLRITFSDAQIKHEDQRLFITLSTKHQIDIFLPEEYPQQRPPNCTLRNAELDRRFQTIIRAWIGQYPVGEPILLALVDFLQNALPEADANRSSVESKSNVSKLFCVL